MVNLEGARQCFEKAFPTLLAYGREGNEIEEGGMQALQEARSAVLAMYMAGFGDANNNDVQDISTWIQEAAHAQKKEPALFLKELSDHIVDWAPSQGNAEEQEHITKIQERAQIIQAALLPSVDEAHEIALAEMDCE